MNFFRLQMVKILPWLLVIYLISSNLFATCAQQRVAIIDTGLDLKDRRFSAHICNDGHHWDFVKNKSVEMDFHGHGTHIAGLIWAHSEDSNYCLLIYRYYDSGTDGRNNLYREIDAIKQAIKDGATVINISGGGPFKSTEECKIIAESPNTTFVLAAGNDGLNIDPPGGYYPASCGSSNIVAVGSIDKYGKRDLWSNYGKTVTAWENGMHVISTLPNDKMGTMSGTSQATAIRTGKIILQRHKECGKNK